jgi:hypothetical protein
MATEPLINWKDEPHHCVPILIPQSFFKSYSVACAHAVSKYSANSVSASQKCCAQQQQLRTQSYFLLRFFSSTHICPLGFK